jgi:hypothetical protein
MILCPFSPRPVGKHLLCWPDRRPVIGVNTVLDLHIGLLQLVTETVPRLVHLHEGTAVIGADTLVTPHLLHPNPSLTSNPHFPGYIHKQSSLLTL